MSVISTSRKDCNESAESPTTGMCAKKCFKVCIFSRNFRFLFRGLMICVDLRGRF